MPHERGERLPTNRFVKIFCGGAPASTGPDDTTTQACTSLERHAGNEPEEKTRQSCAQNARKPQKKEEQKEKPRSRRKDERREREREKGCCSGTSPISRILFRREPDDGDHSSRTTLARRLKPSTRSRNRAGPCGCLFDVAPRRDCPFHPVRRPTRLCCSNPRLTAERRYLLRCPAESGLSSRSPKAADDRPENSRCRSATL